MRALLATPLVALKSDETGVGSVAVVGILKAGRR
jgi:hypothetical protein